MESILATLNLLVDRMCETGKPDPRVLALAVECYQVYIEYLDELEDSMLPSPPQSITVQVQGQTIQFKDSGDLASWITSTLQ